MISLLEKKWFASILLFALAFVLYFPSLQVGFLSDEFHMLSVVEQNSNPLSYFTTNIIGTQEGSSYGPMLMAITIAQYQVFGMNPIGYHVVSIALYGLIAMFVYLFARRISGQWPSLLAGLLFLCLPGHVEAVSWAAVQVHLFATLFFVMSLYYYHRFVRNRKKWYWYVLAMLFAGIALFTKEIAITFIAIFALIDLFYGTSEKEQKKKISTKRILTRVTKRLILPFVVIVGYLFVRHGVTGSLAGYYAGEPEGFTPMKYIRTILEILSSMVLDVPERFQAVQWIADQRGLAAFLVVFVIVLILFAKRLHKKRTFFMALCLLVSLLPYAQVLMNPVNNEGERYGLLPSVFVCIVLVYILYSLLSTFRLTKTGQWLVYVVVIGSCIWFLPSVYSKQGAWMIASQKTNALLASAVDLEIAQDQEVIVVSLPDNYMGAQALRNGFFEALRLQEGIVWNGERVPLYMFVAQDADVHVDHATSEGNKKLISNKSFNVFTGFREYEVGSLKFSLGDFEMPGHYGSSILIDGDFDGKTLVYFDGEKLQKGF